MADYSMHRFSTTKLNTWLLPFVGFHKRTRLQGDFSQFLTKPVTSVGMYHSMAILYILLPLINILQILPFTYREHTYHVIYIFEHYISYYWKKEIRIQTYKQTKW